MRRKGPVALVRIRQWGKQRMDVNSSLVQSDQGIVYVEPKFLRDGSLKRSRDRVQCANDL